MIKIVRTNSENHDFIELVKLLDADLAIKDGEDHTFYSQFNKIDKIKYVIPAYENEKPIGCGAIKEYSVNSVELNGYKLIPNLGQYAGVENSLCFEKELK